MGATSSMLNMVQLRLSQLHNLFIFYPRKYLPVLKKFPDNYIYEPWKAPLSVQKAAGCIIGCFIYLFFFQSFL